MSRTNILEHCVDYNRGVPASETTKNICAVYGDCPKVVSPLQEQAVRQERRPTIWMEITPWLGPFEHVNLCGLTPKDTVIGHIDRLWPHNRRQTFALDEKGAWVPHMLDKNNKVQMCSPSSLCLRTSTLYVQNCLGDEKLYLYRTKRAAQSKTEREHLV